MGSFVLYAGYANSSGTAYLDSMYDYLIGTKPEGPLEPESGLVTSWTTNADSDRKALQLTEKAIQSVRKMVGPEKKQMEMMIKRSDIREIVGNKNLQELHFK